MVGKVMQKSLRKAEGPDNVKDPQQTIATVLISSNTRAILGMSSKRLAMETMPVAITRAK